MQCIRAKLICKQHRATPRSGWCRGLLVALVVYQTAWGQAALPTNTLPSPRGTSPSAGTTSFDTSQTGKLIINQTSDRAVIPWDSFSIGSAAQVQFNLPSRASITLNRVVAQPGSLPPPSQIRGALSSNGQLWLLNPSGVLIGPAGTVNAAGFLASTHRIWNTSLNREMTDAEFLSAPGPFIFNNPGAGAVVNRGYISGQNGYVALFAAEVRNEKDSLSSNNNSGKILTPNGGIALGAGQTVAIDFKGDKLLSFAVNGAPVISGMETSGTVTSTGTLAAEGGKIFLTARRAANLMSSVINTSGVIQANSVTNLSGTVVFGDISIDGGNTGSVSVRGLVLAKGQSDGQDGGTIAVRGQQLTIEADATLDASSLVNGDGGKVRIQGNIDDPLAFIRILGALRANGGSNGGNGGEIETRGTTVAVTGGSGMANAPIGQAGVWRVSAAGSLLGPATPGGTKNYTFNPAQVAGVLANGTHLGLTALSGTLPGGAFVPGDLLVNDPLSFADGTARVRLELRAANNVVLNASVQSQRTGSPIDIALASDVDGDGAGGAHVNQGAALLSRGGNISMGSGNDPATGFARNARIFGTLDARVDGGAAGAITIRGQGNSSNEHGVLIGSNAQIRGGPINIIGLGRNLASLAHGVRIEQGARIEGGGISIEGTANGSGTGVEIGAYAGSLSGTQITALGNLSLVGNGSSAKSRGIALIDKSNLSGASISLNGNAQGGVEGININNAVQLNSQGALSLSATGGQGLFIGKCQTCPVLPQLTSSSPDAPITLSAPNTTVNASIAAPRGLRVLANGGNVVLGMFDAANPAGGKPIELTGALEIQNASTVGVFAKNGLQVHSVAASGEIKLATRGGSIDLTGPIATTGSQAEAVKIVAAAGRPAGDAAGGDILFGNSASIATGSGGGIRLYTGSLSGSTGLGAFIGGVSGRYRYNSDVQTSSFTLPLNPAGRYVIYRERPLITLTAPGGQIIYGQPEPQQVQFAGLVNGDTPTIALPSAPTVSFDGSRSSAGRLVAGVHDSTIAPYVTSPLGYGFDLKASVLTVLQRALTISGITARDKTYDATTTATLNMAGVVRAGLIDGDVVTVSASGQFTDKNVARNSNGDPVVRAVNLTSSYGGADVGNYAITDQSTTTATIKPKALTISGITARDKTYDATTTATVSTASVLRTGLIDGDVVTVSASGQFTDKNVARNANGNPTAKAVTLTSTYGGADAGNYAITSQPFAPASIRPRPISIGITGNPAKTADGTAVATLNPGNFLVTNLAEGEKIAVTQTEGTYRSVQAGTDISVSASVPSDKLQPGDLTLLSNYRLPDAPATGTGTILPPVKRDVAQTLTVLAVQPIIPPPAARTTHQTNIPPSESMTVKTQTTTSTATTDTATSTGTTTTTPSASAAASTESAARSSPGETTSSPTPEKTSSGPTPQTQPASTEKPAEERQPAQTAGIDKPAEKSTATTNATPNVAPPAADRTPKLAGGTAASTSAVPQEKPPTPRDTSDAGDRTLAAASSPAPPKPAAQERRQTARRVEVTQGLALVEPAPRSTITPTSMRDARTSMNGDAGKW